MLGASGIPMVNWGSKSVILGSVAAGPYANYGNALIERATLAALGLASDTPRFSLFEPMTETLARHINTFELAVFTGCTILDGRSGHQGFFNQHCLKIRIPKLLCAGAYCCEPGDKPSGELAQWFDPPLAARDPWTHKYLKSLGLDTTLVGCPTLFEPFKHGDHENADRTLLSLTPRLNLSKEVFNSFGRVRVVRHQPGERQAEDARSPGLFDGVRMTVTGRLHLALPSIARGIPVRFFGPDHWMDAKVRRAAGSTRFSLLDYLEVPQSGEVANHHPGEQIQHLREAFQHWARAC